MLDTPDARALLDAAIGHLRGVVLPALQGRAAFDLRVALSALDLAARELAASTEVDAETASLQALLDDASSDLADLNRALARRIDAKEIGADNPALIAHLYRVTIAKLAVDQPSYSTYRRYVEEAS